jgi:hydrogenase maturation protein HypF
MIIDATQVLHTHVDVAEKEPADLEESQRRRIIVQGIVQGVGFRPFVYGLAQRWKLAGFVLNDSAGVTIEVEGSVRTLDRFLQALREEAPPLARIDSLVVERLSPLGEEHFVIVHSQASAERHALISPDVSICDACLHELFDPANRRYHYPFINCTNCGPRFTIVQDIPYDREKTTMRVFPMCPDCQREYEDPLNRRFHAQPNACPVCGPQLRFLDWSAAEETEAASAESTSDPVDTAAGAIACGAILAVKGLGGYHLACDALDNEAVKRLRQGKQREARPFALMVPNLETAMLLCKVNAEEAALLQSPRRPILLLQKKNVCVVAPDVAPGCDTLGIMLPYAPVHYLLMQSCTKIFEKNRPVALVMTSGNLSDEPIAYRDEDAFQRLSTIADGALGHNREIHMRCDDSVLRVTSHGTQFFRRSRGYVSEPLRLAWEFPIPILASGAHLKNTFCLGKGHQAFLSHHIGDLENLETLLSFREGISHFQRLFAIAPEAIAYDIHPEYLATKYALETSIPWKIGVQHHHAHIASVMAEHGLTEPLIGIAADGTGYGTDGTVWGGEILVGDLRRFNRLAYLAHMPLPGGDQAVRQPWRMGAVYLARAYGEDFFALNIPFVRHLDQKKWHALSQMIFHGVNCPTTSSMGRLFDAVAALLGLCNEALYEGQAAIALEVQARMAEQTNAGTRWEKPDTGYPFCIETGTRRMDVMPMIKAIVWDLERRLPIPLIAWRFHDSLAEMLALSSEDIRQQTGLNTIALSGGVFQNRLLLELLVARLEKMAFRVYINQLVPCNDGGISLGQAAIASARLRMEVRPTFEWRGMGFIPESALKLRPEFADWDAELRFSVPGIRVADPKAASAVKC